MSKSPESGAALRWALALHQRGDLSGAARAYREILKTDASNAPALHFLGAAEASFGNMAEALRLTAQSIALEPRNLLFCENYAGMLLQAGDGATALKIADRGLKLKADSLRLLHARAAALGQQSRFEEASKAYARLLGLVAKSPDIVVEHALVQLKLLDLTGASASVDAALSLQPNHARAHFARACVLQRQDEPAAALAAIETALSLGPDDLASRSLHVELLIDSGQMHQAIEASDRLLASHPALARIHLARGKAMVALARNEEALMAFGQAIDLQHDLVEAHNDKGVLLAALGRNEAAIEAFSAALAVDESTDFARGHRHYLRMKLCDWTDFDAESKALIARAGKGERCCNPFELFPTEASPAVRLAAADSYTARMHPPTRRPLWHGGGYNHDRLRIAYVSADFKEHPVARLIAGAMEAHDRERFDITAISLSAAPGDPLQDRIRLACDDFLTVTDHTDRAIAELIHAREIDIAVDLMGHTVASRPSVFAQRPAPVQVGFLGFPGSVGKGLLDYLIADRITVPPDHAHHYAEAIAWLPETVFLSDDKLAIATETPTRQAVGLPANGLVFCAFGLGYKVTPDVFAIWMRLLKAIDGSVLWLSAQSATATANLRREAAAAGVSPERLVFADRVASHADHLARHRLADLFLDTLHYNAHTTANEALWAGLPVLTRLGGAFSGRVAASQLQAIGLQDLITTSASDYEDLALSLARNPARLVALRETLKANRLTHPLFRTERYTRHLEQAFRHMAARVGAGDTPQSFAVPPLG